jgi:hypothetical protein
MTQMATRRMRTPGYGRGRPGRWVVIVVILVGVLVALDFGARVEAESVMASKIQQQGLPSKPSVSIGGFPFLTQVALKDFRHITISATNIPAGPVTISSISAAASGVKLKSYAFSSGTIGSLSGTALITFGSLGNTLSAQFGPLGSLLNGTGLKLSEASPDEIQATINLLVTSGTAVWRVTRDSGNSLHIHLVSSSGLPSSLTGSIQDLTLQIPKLPLGLTIKSVRVTPSGVVGQVTGHDVPFGS